MRVYEYATRFEIHSARISLSTRWILLTFLTPSKPGETSGAYKNFQKPMGFSFFFFFRLIYSLGIVRQVRSFKAKNEGMKR
jgi:hypothetical protein